MDRRSYNQFCCLAMALDHIGDRWILLIVRELLFGARRYSDLRAALPGVASNLLSARLRALEADGLVTRQRLPPPAAATVYALTDSGRALEPALIELVRWGSRWMDGPADDRVVRASWLGLALKSLLGSPRRDLNGQFDLVVGDERITIRVKGGRLAIDAFPGLDNHDRAMPAAQLTTSADAVIAIATGASSIASEVDSGRAEIDGTPDAIRDLASILSFR